MDVVNHRNEKTLADLAGCMDPERRSSPHNAVSLHGRLLDLETAHATESKKFGEYEQHRGTVEQFLSQDMQTAHAHATESKKLGEYEQHRGTIEQFLDQDMQNTWTIVNNLLPLATQTVEPLQKRHNFIQEQVGDLTASAMNAGMAASTAASPTTSMPLARPAVLPEESLLGKTVAKLDEVLAQRQHHRARRCRVHQCQP